MMRLIITVLALAFVQLAAAAPDASKAVDCSKLEEVLEDMGGAQGITTLNDKYKLATNEKDLAARCAEATEAIKVLRKYNKECYSSLTQQVFSAILRTRSQMNDAHCKPGTPEFKETYEAMQCVQDSAFEPVQKAERKTILTSQVLHESNIPDDKLRTRRACCNVIASKDFFIEATKEKCSKYEKVYVDYVDSYTSEAMGLICPEPDKLECDKLEKLQIDGVEPKSKFFLSPMLKLVKTLDH